MNNRTSQLARLAAALVVAGAIIVIVALNSGHPNLAPQLKLRHSEASLVSSALDYYYVSNNQYPTHMSDLYKIADASTKSAAADLKDLRYSVTGDGQSYKFTYFDGQHTQTASGNYSKDYHGE